LNEDHSLDLGILDVYKGERHEAKEQRDCHHDCFHEGQTQEFDLLLIDGLACVLADDRLTWVMQDLSYC
jgi:hypothetical protein